VGTSKAFRGPSSATPLVPTWQAEPEKTPVPGLDIEPPAHEPNFTTIHLPTLPNRFSAPRRDFTSFTKSGGSDHQRLKRAVGRYISGGLGGTQRAIRRMGSSRRAAGRFLSFVQSVSTQGIDRTLREYHREDLIGRPSGQILSSLTDLICSPGTTIDESIARAAFIDTIVELLESGLSSLEVMSIDELDAFLDRFVTKSICMRIVNDIANKSLDLPSSDHQLDKIQDELESYVSEAVKTGMKNNEREPRNLRPAEIQQMVDEIYKSAFDLLLSLEE